MLPKLEELTPVKGKRDGGASSWPLDNRTGAKELGWGERGERVWMASSCCGRRLFFLCFETLLSRKERWMRGMKNGGITAETP